MPSGEQSRSVWRVQFFYKLAPMNVSDNRGGQKNPPSPTLGTFNTLFKLVSTAQKINQMV